MSDQQKRLKQMEIIDAACDRFEKAVQQKEPPKIEDYLAEVETDIRDQLMEELLKLELTYASIAGNLPQLLAGLKKRFPDDVDLIDKVFANSALVETNVPLSADEPIQDVAPTALSRVIGPYKLLQEIGHGGMGTVYMAEQSEPVRRRVALKLIRPGMGSKEIIARFEAERQALAMMDHTNIAKVLDAGTTDEGILYFVMELVRGIPITEYCDKYKLSIEDRLDLFQQSCRAIQHAHQKGIIHRDIKPSNVLVTEHDDVSIVKVIDFGLAKALQNTNRLTDKTMFTEIGQVVGTVQYMSPEQTEMNALDVDTRSDVYSLGVLLYELLTGSTPLERQSLKEMALDRVMAAIRDEEPQRPSQRLSSIGDSATQISQQRKTDVRKLGIILKGDLDWIAMKALEKDRVRRYDSPVQLTEDVQRYLDSEAILARPPSLSYRISKAVKRHRSAIFAASLVLIVLVGGIIGTSWQWNRARVAAEQASTDLARSNYFLAIARWDENRVGDAIDFLEKVPKKHRHFEWHLARNQFEGGDLTCYGHTAPVNSVSFSPDGRRIVSGSKDNSIKIWNAETGEEIRTLSGHKDIVTSVSFNHSGKKIISASMDKTIRIWNAQSGKELQTLVGHKFSIGSVSYSPDDRQIVSRDTQTTRIWDALTGEEKQILRGGHSNVSFSPNGLKMTSSSGNGQSLSIWDARTGAELRILNGHKFTIHSVSFSPDGRHIVAGGFKTIIIWDAQTGEELNTLRGHSGSVKSVSFSPNGRKIVSGCETIKIWDAGTGEEIRTLRGHANFVSSVSFSPNGQRIVSGSNDNTIKLWDEDSGKELKTIKGHNSFVKSVSFSPDSRRIVSGSSDHAIKIWDAESGENLNTLNGHTSSASSVSFSPNGRKVVSRSDDNTIKVWDAQSGEEMQTLKGHTRRVSSVSFSPDSRQLVSGSWDESIKVWDAQSGEELRTLNGHAGIVTSVSFSPDGRRIISGGYKTIKIWDVRTGEELWTWGGHIDVLLSVSFSPNGRQIAYGDHHTIKIRDVQNGVKLRILRGHTSEVTSVSFSPDGRRIASGGIDNTIKIWDAQSGEELRTLAGHSGIVSSVSFSPDGRRIVSGSFDKTIKVWVAESGAELRTLKGHTKDVSSVTFSLDGKELSTLDNSGSKIVWSTETWRRLSEPERKLKTTLNQSTPTRDMDPNGRWQCCRQ